MVCLPESVTHRTTKPKTHEHSLTATLIRRRCLSASLKFCRKTSCDASSISNRPDLRQTAVTSAFGRTGTATARSRGGCQWRRPPSCHGADGTDDCKQARRLITFARTGTGGRYCFDGRLSVCRITPRLTRKFQSGCS